ncbi:MAG TPA: aminoglycoside phosphotransferase family protein [Propionibacteriaceae bacterium]
MRDLTFIRSRPWATLYRVDAAEGRWWLKINHGLTVYEPRILSALTGLGSALVPEALTHDDEPWALIADAGTEVRAVWTGRERAEQVRLWSEVVVAYAELQQSMTLAGRPAGVPDFTPGAALTRFDEVVADLDWFGPECAPDLTPPEWDRVRGCRPYLAQAVARLAGGLAPSIQHDDLHDANVLSDGERARIIDWGDAVWAHPFQTMLITLDSLAATWRVSVEDADVRRVRDAYVDAWRGPGWSIAELREQLQLARRTGGLTRAACWIRALGTPVVARELDSADAPAHWMVRLADALTPSG